MRWYRDPQVLPFDTRPQESRPAGWYRFVSPPGLRGMTDQSVLKFRKPAR
jgi:predicted methyltransferase